MNRITTFRIAAFHTSNGTLIMSANFSDETLGKMSARALKALSYAIGKALQQFGELQLLDLEVGPKGVFIDFETSDNWETTVERLKFLADGYVSVPYTITDLVLTGPVVVGGVPTITVTGTLQGSIVHALIGPTALVA